MKLSLFPGVSLDVFNNKHFSQIFISHSEEEILVTGSEGVRVQLFVLVPPPPLLIFLTWIIEHKSIIVIKQKKKKKMHLYISCMYPYVYKRGGAFKVHLFKYCTKVYF